MMSPGFSVNICMFMLLAVCFVFFCYVCSCLMKKIRNLLAPDTVLQRWMNLSLGRPMNTDIGNYGADLYSTLRKNDPSFASKSPQLNNGKDS